MIYGHEPTDVSRLVGQNLLVLHAATVPAQQHYVPPSPPPTPKVKVTATPWCENGLRLRLQPDRLPAAAVQTQAAQEKLLKERGLKEMPSALLLGGGGCKPGAPAELGPASIAATSGNIMAKALVGGGIGVYTVDTAKLLFTAKATFETKEFGPALPDSCVSGPYLRGNDLYVANTYAVLPAVNTMAWMFLHQRLAVHVCARLAYCIALQSFALPADKGYCKLTGPSPTRSPIAPPQRRASASRPRLRRAPTTPPSTRSTSRPRRRQRRIQTLPGARGRSPGRSPKATSSPPSTSPPATPPSASTAWAKAAGRGQRRPGYHQDLRQGKIPAAAPCAPVLTLSQRKKFILGVLYGVLLWADMDAATPLGASGRAVMPLAQVIVPLERNGQEINLQQTKYHVTIPFALSTTTGGQSYGFLFNMPGAGKVTVGEAGAGGMHWTAEASLGMDIWITAPPKATPAHQSVAAIYKQYADATGHAPPLREDAMGFWQSRNRYKSSAIALSVAQRYADLELPVGVVVIDYKNQHVDGDFAPNSDCYPSVKALSGGIRSSINATTMFSFWPEAQNASAEFSTLLKAGCLMNADLYGSGIDATIPTCRRQGKF